MEFNYKIIKSAKRKRTTALQVNTKGQIVVRAPKNATNHEIQDFVEKNKDWILKRLNEVKTALNYQKNFVNGETFLILGHPYTLKVLNTNKKLPKISFSNGFLIIQKPQQASDKKIKKAVIKWYKKQGKGYLQNRVDFFANKIGKTYNKITIKSVSSLWGSCSAKDNLNFNYKILMAPKNVLDYVVIHEVCHLVHRNHGKRFWNLVAKIDPNYKQNRKLLRKNSHILEI